MKPVYQFAAGLVLLATAGASLAGDGLGTLFTTETEREELDTGVRAIEPAQAESTAPAPAAAHRVKVSGTFVSSSGQRRVWLDGQVDSGTLEGEQARVVDAGHVRLENGGVYQSVRPGQVLDRDADRVYESYQLDQATGPGTAPTSE